MVVLFEFPSHARKSRKEKGDMGITKSIKEVNNMDGFDCVFWTILILVVAVGVLTIGFVCHVETMELYRTDFGKCITYCSSNIGDEYREMECLQECIPLADCIRLIPI